MFKIFVSIFTIITVVFVFNLFADEITIPSIQKDVRAFLDKRRGAEISNEDKAIMMKAAQDLAKAMPEPGLRVGERAPDFTLVNAFGERVKLSEQMEKGPVIVTFYRGAWCPFCNIELNALQKSLPYYDKYNASLIAITPQKPDMSNEQIKKARYTFEILSDLDNSVMKSYKLYFEVPQELHELYKKRFNFDITDYNGKGRLGLPVPGTFVIGQDGVIRAAHAKTDYKKRMEPKDILEALKVIK